MTFLQTLSKIETSPDLLMTIKIEINRMRKGKAQLNIYSFIPEIRESIISQRIIGWKIFLEGLVSKEIIKLQKDYLTSNNSKQTGNVWASNAIRAG